MTTICSCPIETTAHHPSCVHAELLSDVGAFVMGEDQVEAAQIAHRLNAERHRFGPLAATREPS